MKIDIEVLKIGIDRYSNQTVAPLSPGLFDKTDGPQLCAAAIIAYAGIYLKYGENRADEFAWKTCNSSDNREIFNAFSLLNYDIKIGKSALVENDNFDDSDRKSGVIKYFRSLIED